MTRQFYIQDNVGSAKYVVNHHDGVKTHEDGSLFFDVTIFKSKKKRYQFCQDLASNGYGELMSSGDANAELVVTPEMLAEFRSMVRHKLMMWDASTRLERLIDFEIDTSEIDNLCACLDSAEDVESMVGMKELVEYLEDQR